VKNCNLKGQWRFTFLKWRHLFVVHPLFGFEVLVMMSNCRCIVPHLTCNIVSEKNHASGILLDSMTTLSAENTLPSDLRLIHQLQLQQLQTQCQACTGCTIMDAFKAHSPLGLANRAQWVTQCSCSSHQFTCCTAKRFEGVDGHVAAFKTGLESEHLSCC